MNYKRTCSCGDISTGEGRMPDNCHACGKSTSRMTFGEFYKRPFLQKGRAKYMSPAMERSVAINKRRWEADLKSGKVTPDQLKFSRTSPDLPDSLRKYVTE